MAIVLPVRPPAHRDRDQDLASSAALARLLEGAAHAEPNRVAFRDGPGREAYSGRPSFELSCEIAHEAVARLRAL